MTEDDYPDYNDPAASAEDLAEEAWGHLAAHPDAVLRYQAIGLLESRLRHLRALTAKQLELELGSLGQAAEALGVTRQAVTDLYARTDTPGPRADQDRANRPASIYGRWIALAELASNLTEHHGSQRDRLITQAIQTTTVYPALVRQVEQWLVAAERVRRTKQRAAELRTEIDAASPGLGALVSRQLTMVEQGDVILALHSTRAQWRDRVRAN